MTEELKALIEGLSRDWKDVTPQEYGSMKYPKLIPMMRFRTGLFEKEGYGRIFMMETSGMGGAMKLLTLSFMPSGGKDVPYLLIDTMSMKKKALAYIEYYDCSGKGLAFPELEALKEKYSSLPDYAEKEAWYIRERMDISLIKGGENADEKALFSMAEESIRTYLKLSETAAADPANIKGLAAFRERMLREGNPSGPTMEKVLGKDGAAEFFKRCVMPLS